MGDDDLARGDALCAVAAKKLRVRRARASARSDARERRERARSTRTIDANE
jgi:hypothetical protein